MSTNANMEPDDTLVKPTMQPKIAPIAIVKLRPRQVSRSNFGNIGNCQPGATVNRISCTSATSVTVRMATPISRSSKSSKFNVATCCSWCKMPTPMSDPGTLPKANHCTTVRSTVCCRQCCTPPTTFINVAATTSELMATEAGT